MTKQEIELGMQVCHTLETFFNTLNDNQPVDPRFRHLVEIDALGQIAAFRKSMSEGEVDTTDVQEEVAPEAPSVPEGMVEHTITEEDIENNPGIENDVKPGDEVLIPAAESGEGEEAAKAEDEVQAQADVDADQAAQEAAGAEGEANAAALAAEAHQEEVSAPEEGTGTPETGEAAPKAE